MRSKIFTFTGDFGGGKTLTGVSFTPHGWDGKALVRRILVDMEMRGDTYQSPDGLDHPEKLQYAYMILNDNGPMTGALFHDLMSATHRRDWPGNEAPHVIIVDDTAMLQTMMWQWWSGNIDNAKKTAALYGMEKHRVFRYGFAASDAGTIDMFKEFFKNWMLELKAQNITLIITSPLHNIWVNYGDRGRDADGNPKMKTVGKSAKVWDCWIQLTDVVWKLTRKVPGDKEGTFKSVALPIISMDTHIQKAALPGLKEKFAWPDGGWATIWQWYDERKFTADVKSLPQESATYSDEQLTEMRKKDYGIWAQKLSTLITFKDLGDLLREPDMPTYEKADEDVLTVRVLQVWAERHPELEEKCKALAFKLVPDEQAA